MDTASAGAVIGARAAFEAQTQNGNQENHVQKKSGASTNMARQKGTGNARAPLSHISSSGRLGTGNRNDAEPHETPSTEVYDDIPENMYRPEVNEKGWINREKLAKIENEELQAAGINLAKQRSKSKDLTGRKSRNTSVDNSGLRDGKRQRLASPTNEELDGIEEQETWDLRSPEEVAAEESAARMYSSPSLRKSGSKIPVMTSSPTPIGSERYDRETPMPRKRTMSGSISPDEVLYGIKTSAPGSPSKTPSSLKTKSPSASISKIDPTTPSAIPTVRKGSFGNKLSSTTSNERPPTRGNDTDRPQTASRAPEGDPPWLATMYKPDPMLPPDQQLIPTLAKKQMQEQWAREGQVPQTYDKDFSTLAVHPESAPGTSKPTEPGPIPQSEQQLSGEWPLVSGSEVLKASPSSSALNGGYSTMPKVTPTPSTAEKNIRGGSPALSPALGAPLQPVSSNNSRQSKTGSKRQTEGSSTGRVGDHPRLQPLTDAEEEKVPKKGCGCCIVM